MKVTENMLSEAIRKVSEELAEKWEKESENQTHEFSEKYETFRNRLISKEKEKYE